MNRREALRRVSLVLGGAVAAPIWAGVLCGCQSGPVEAPYTPQALTPDLYNLVTTLSERILPETDTPGATGTGVNRFIDQMLHAWFLPEDRDRFMAGLQEVEARAQSVHQAGFLALAEAQQVALMQTLDAEAYPEVETMTEEEQVAFMQEMEDTGPRFFAMLKQLTLVGYYTSEVGGTQELTENPMGVWNGDLPYAEVGRAYA